MPANVVETDMNPLSAGLEDQRALQIALELTKLGLNDNDAAPTSAAATGGYERDVDGTSASRKSANMTECVPVPSSEHVAEIVGRQGKNLCLRFTVCVCVCVCVLDCLGSPPPSPVHTLVVCVCVCVLVCGLALLVFRSAD